MARQYNAGTPSPERTREENKYDRIQSSSPKSRSVCSEGVCSSKSSLRRSRLAKKLTNWQRHSLQRQQGTVSVQLYLQLQSFPWQTFRERNLVGQLDSSSQIVPCTSCPWGKASLLQMTAQGAGRPFANNHHCYELRDKSPMEAFWTSTASLHKVTNAKQSALSASTAVPSHLNAHVWSSYTHTRTVRLVLLAVSVETVAIFEPGFNALRNPPQPP